MPLAGKRLTPFEVAKLCYKHGMDPDAGQGVNMVTAIGVCFGESSFFTGAWYFNKASNDQSYGLWQINLLGSLGPERRKKYSLKADTHLYNPDINCKIMMDMSKGGTNWKPWGAYTSGSYRAALPLALAARKQLLRQMGRPVKPVPIPPEKMVPLALRPWISYYQVRKAAEARIGVYKSPGGDSSRDDVANYQRGLWRLLLQEIDYMYIPGVYDESTKRATALFQRKQGWKGADADGIIGPETMKRVEAKSELFRARDYRS